jgi:hypothetical protein
VKNGRDAFAKVISAECGMGKAVARLKGRELDALIHYAEGLGDEDGPNEIIGAALIVAAGRYLSRVRAKAAKRARRAKKIL